MCTITYVSLFFSNRLVALWQSLPNTLVSAESNYTFKLRSDAHHDFKFDWNADVSGMGGRSINSLSVA